MMVWIIGWIIFGIAASYVASQKGKGGGLWFFLGILLGPLALLMVGLSPAAPTMTQTDSASLRKCPFCAESIKFEALVCKHCGREVMSIDVISPDILAAFDMIEQKYGKLSAGGMSIELGRLGFSKFAIDQIVKNDAIFQSN